MAYTLGQAAKATGKSKSTLQAAIKKGRVSALQDETGQYHIDPAELHRVYPPISQTDRTSEPQSEQNRPPFSAEKEAEIRSLKARLEVMEQLVSELRGDKEKAEKREAEAAEREANLWQDITHWKAMTNEAQQRLKILETSQRGSDDIVEGRTDGPLQASAESDAGSKKGRSWKFWKRSA